MKITLNYQKYSLVIVNVVNGYSSLKLKIFRAISSKPSQLKTFELKCEIKWKLSIFWVTANFFSVYFGLFILKRPKKSRACGLAGKSSE